MKKVIRLYYGFQFFFPLLLWLPIFYEYQKRMGLSDPQIFGIQSLYYIVFCLLEIPTGVFADRWGYRQSLRLGAATIFVGNLLPIFSFGYQGFLAHFFLVALSRSLISGASNAYLYEYLKRHRSVEKYKLVEGNARAYGLVGKVVCWSVVGALMEWHITLPYWLSALCSLISFIYAESLPEQANPPESGRGMAGFWSGKFLPMVSTLRRSPFLLMVMFQGVGIFVLARLCQVNLYQPILQEKNFSLISYGWLMAAMTIFEAWGSARPNWLQKIFSDVSAVFLLTIVVALSLSLIAISDKAGTMMGLFLFAYATGLAYPIQRQVLNDAITDSRFRATLLSVESIIDRTICAAIVPFIAGFVSEGKTSLFLNISAGATVVFVVLLVMLNSFRKDTPCSEKAA
ncbi:MAG: MFS transporter [Candidatus Ozemobacteraceae bacterium]